jgi:polysaccharide biosynthesis protein PelD
MQRERGSQRPCTTRIVEHQRSMILSSVESLPPAVAVIESENHADRRDLRLRSWLEILAITVVIPLGISWINPDDPFLVRGPFPWLALLSLLVGAQHGALGAAVHSSLLFATACAYDAQVGFLDVAALGAWGGGCLATGVIAGYFRDRVEGRLTHLSRQARDRAQHLARLSRAHAVLKVSHQKLEERLSAQGWSLESAVEDTRQELAASASLPALCQSILNILSNHAMVQAATLFTVVSGGADRRPCDLAVAAKLGHPPAVDAAHRLIARALETGRLVALDAESTELGSDESVLVAVPLLAASGRAIGVVVVHEMPFMAFQATNLKALAALCAHLADVLAARLHPRAETFAKTTDVNAFVGTRTGTHRRRNVAQSA